MNYLAFSILTLTLAFQIFSKLKDVKQNKALYSPTRKAESQSVAALDSPDVTTTVLPKISNATGNQSAGHSNTAKGRSAAGSSTKENCVQRQPTVKQAAVVEKSSKAPPQLQCDVSSSSEEDRAPVGGSKRAQKYVSPPSCYNACCIITCNNVQIYAQQ